MRLEPSAFQPSADSVAAAPDRRVVWLTPGREDPRVRRGILQAARELDWNFTERRESDDGQGWLLRSGGCAIQLITDGSDGHGEPAVITLELAHTAAGALAARHLLALDFPHLAFYRSDRSAASERLKDAFSRECLAAGKPARDLTGSNHTLETALRSLPMPCAIFAATDEDAADVIDAANTIGLAIPSKFAVLGCGNQGSGGSDRTGALSSIDLNHENAGYLAARLLDRLLSGEVLPKNRWTIRLKGVIERESTCRFHGDHPGVAHTLLRIRRDYAEPLTVPLLAREAGMSVRTLQRVYGAITGSVISEDLLNQRLEAAAGLLQGSSLKLEAIASAVGLGNANRLCRLFRLRFGRTPNQCRTSRTDRRSSSFSDKNSPMLSQ